MLRSGLTEKVEAEKALDFKFPDPPQLSPPVLQCNDITFGYPGCEILYKNVDFGVDLDSRVALVGPNGAGKSTLLKLMTGELQPLTGVVRPHAHLRIAKFSQHFVDVLDLSLSPLDYFLSLWTDMTREDGRKFLGRFGISGTVQTQVMSQLSDGQKTRVVLAKMAKESPHLLFLDEPTNHLDMESIDSLAKAINNFKGGMVLVSHDMRLISQVAKEIWLCDHRTVAKYVGEIADFKMQLRRQMKIDSDGGAVEIQVVPLVSKKLSSYSDPNAIPDIAPIIAPVAPVVKPPAPPTKKEEGDEEDEDGEGNEQEDKAAARARRKAEREAAAALRQREEEERVRRREEKLREAEEAKRVLEEEQRKIREFEAQKAEKERVREEELKAEAEELARQEAERVAARKARKAEKEARKRALLEAKQKAFVEAVLNDVWTQEQQVLFEDALLANPSEMEKKERWQKVSEAVGDKSAQQCLARYKYLKQLILSRKAS
eukprot:scaffold644_cov168-Ochromonas_danica.AAC.14